MGWRNGGWGSGIRRWSAVGAVLLLLAGGLGAGGAAAEAGSIDLWVLVSHITDEPGPIDPRGRKVHEKLRERFRYESLKVLVEKRLHLALEQVGTVELPNGRSLRMRPLDVGEAGVLMAVDVEGTIDIDMRVPNKHLVVVGADPYEGGQMVISLEPEF